MCSFTDFQGFFDLFCRGGGKLVSQSTVVYFYFFYYAGSVGKITVYNRFCCLFLKA